MNKFTSIISLIFFAFHASSQSIDRRVVSTAGNTSTASNLIISQTIGDIGSSLQGSILLAGFQQSYISEVPAAIGINHTPSNIQIYPNPFADYILIEANEKIDKMDIVIRNVLGQSIFVQKLDSNVKSVRITTQELPSGVYYLEIKDINGKIQAFKLIKN